MNDEAAFHRFWSEYPKKRSKGDAWRAWIGTAEQRPPIAQLLKALVVLMASEDWRKDGGKFIPYPSTWLRAWGWEDVPEVELKDVTRDGKMWWQSVAGIEAKAKELGEAPWDGRWGGELESFQQYTKRIRLKAESNVIPMVKRA